LGRGKSGLEDEIENLRVRPLPVRVGEAALDGFLENPLALEATSVVRHLDDDAARVMEGVQGHGPDGRFSGGSPDIRGLDAMVDRVADQMRQGVGDALHQRLVELGLLSVHDEADLLAQLSGDVVDDPLEALERAADLHHAQLERALTNLLDEGGKNRGGLVQLTVAAAACGQRGTGRGSDQFPDASDEVVELDRVHPDRASGGFGSLAGGGFLRGESRWRYRGDTQRAVLTNELEGRFDASLARAAVQIDLEPDVTLRGLVAGGRGQGIIEKPDAQKLSERPQVADEPQRVHPRGEDIAAEADADVPYRRLLWRPFGRAASCCRCRPAGVEAAGFLQRANQLLALLLQLRVVARGEVGDEGLDVVLATQQQCDQLARQAYPVQSHGIQHRLHDVHEVDDHIQSEQACGALQRVSAAEDEVDRLRVSGVGRAGEESRLHLAQDLRTLGNEPGQCVVEVHGLTTRSESPHKPRTSATAGLALSIETPRARSLACLRAIRIT